MPKAEPEDSPAAALAQDVATAGLALGQVLLKAEADVLATVVGLAKASAPHVKPRSAEEIAADELAVEEGFDNMPL